MRTRIIVLAIIVAVGLLIIAPATFADTLKFKDGTEREGVIKKVETGRVFVTVGGEMQEYDILTIDSMDFNTPHILTSTENIPMEHFLKDVEAQEVVRNFEELEKTEKEVRSMLTDIRAYWNRIQPIPAADLKGWETEKEEFRKPLSRYQELLNDLYFHFLTRVDGYNAIANEASDVYVGVKGIRTGSSLIPKDMKKLPLTKYVPGAWYDTIYFDGYNRGYEDAYQKFQPATGSND
jgi:type IV secretory pathway VirB4 component